MGKDCRDCKWAEWQMKGNLKPRIDTSVSGRCRYEVVAPVLPRCSTLQMYQLGGKMAIWHKKPYTDCPAWELKELATR